MIVLSSFTYSKAVCATKKHVIKITRGSSNVFLFAAQEVQVRVTCFHVVFIWFVVERFQEPSFQIFADDYRVTI